MSFNKHGVNDKAKSARPDLPRDSEGYNGWSNWDTWATMLMLDNTQSTNRWLDDWALNFRKKEKGNRFDREKARYVVLKYLVPVAKGQGSLAKQFMSNKYDPFTPEEDIDPAKVNTDEIVNALLERGRDREKYATERKIAKEEGIL